MTRKEGQAQEWGLVRSLLLMERVFNILIPLMCLFFMQHCDL